MTRLRAGHTNAGALVQVFNRETLRRVLPGAGAAPLQGRWHLGFGRTPYGFLDMRRLSSR